MNSVAVSLVRALDEGGAKQLAEAAARRLNLLADPARLLLLALIFKHDGQLSVVQLVEELAQQGYPMTQSNAARHLSGLHRVGLINRRTTGKLVIYSVNKSDGGMRALFPVLGELVVEKPVS